MSPSAVRTEDAVEIVDIHQSDMDFSLADEIYSQIDPPAGTPRSFPTLLLYDAKGLKLFEKITYLDEYYLTNTEIEVLTANAKRIVERIPKNAQVVELGSGSVVLALHPQPGLCVVERRCPRRLSDTFSLEICARSRSCSGSASARRSRWTTMRWISLWMN